MEYFVEHFCVKREVSADRPDHKLNSVQMQRKITGVFF